MTTDPRPEILSLLGEALRLAPEIRVGQLVAFLGDVVRRHPGLRECADLAEGQSVSTADRRTVAYITAADRRTSKRAWTLAEPA